MGWSGIHSMTKVQQSNPHGLAESIMVERHEAKYIIPRSMVAEIRQYIVPFCSPDHNGSGNPPEYIITTLQLDTPTMSLHHAKEMESVARFKLRVRTYGTDGKAPVFVEVKRKIKGVVVKSRASIPRSKWCKALVLDPTRKLDISFRSSKEEYAFLEFVRLVRETGSAPKVLIRYTRESYISHVDDYARITFDRRLLYQPACDWESFGENNRWRVMDTPLIQDKDFRFSGLVLEIKTMSNVPTWVLDLVQKFDLARMGNCKYSSAIWCESVFGGTPAAPDFATELFIT